ncbi:MULTISPECIES: hypothetical protein [Halobacteriovorax]|uniref:Uncharacterized protein n=1 Tax=Halobacteriovorax vibrionivorans TaxID=2152716 RepID=A0ABY0IHQ7_9BACT|nr:MULTISPECIES: hypothetical protein [Halobacteriovorax]RZF22483.1 hypothetical protein DAY19_01555 [Halobacteriovorax vibrionivorans]TGD47674.1 hypothetical protein EP118_06915 [Halobacteriovorax sp. Y22]
MKNKKVLFWSGGLTSLATLKKLLESHKKDEIILLCLLNKEGNELGHTGIPEEVLQLQARYLGLKLVRLYQDELSKKVLEKFVQQGFEFYCGSRDGHFIETTPLLNSLKVETPLKGIAYTELMEQDQSRTILTSVQNEEDQRLLGKEISDISQYLQQSNQRLDTFVIYDPLFRIRIPFSKNIVVEKDGYFICKIRSV